MYLFVKQFFDDFLFVVSGILGLDPKIHTETSNIVLPIGDLEYKFPQSNRAESADFDIPRY